MPIPRHLVTPLKALPEVRDAALFGSGLHIVTPDDAAAIAAINDLLTARGLWIILRFTMETILPSMEDVFISLIEEVDRKNGKKGQGGGQSMNLRRLTAVARKETLHLVRDWRSLTLALAIPLILILLYGYALTLDLRLVPTVVWDQSRTPESRELLSLFQSSPYFAIKGYHDRLPRTAKGS